MNGDRSRDRSGDIVRNRSRDRSRDRSGCRDGDRSWDRKWDRSRVRNWDIIIWIRDRNDGVRSVPTIGINMPQGQCQGP
jgi:hypothetical protein